MRESRRMGGKRAFYTAVLILALALPAKAVQAETLETSIQWLTTKGRPAYYISEFDWLTLGGGKVINRKTEELIEEYKHAFPFQEGLAVVTQRDAAGNDKRGYMDLEGNVVIPPEYDWANGFCEGVATVRKEDENGKRMWYVIDGSGKVLAELDYYEVGNFSCGLTWVHVKDGKYGYVDKTGALVIPLDYYYAEGFSAKTGLAKVKVYNQNNDAKYGFINASGEMVISAEYDDADSFSGTWGLAAVEKGEKWSYIDSSGTVVLEVEYDQANSFYSDGIASVFCYEGQKMRYGLINTNGELIVELQYDKISSFVDGLAAVMRRDEEENEKWGFMDTAGNIVIPLEYKDASCLGGVAWVQRYEDGAYGIFANPYSSERPAEENEGGDGAAAQPTDLEDGVGIAPDSSGDFDAGEAPDREDLTDAKGDGGILIASVAVCAAAAAGAATVLTVRKKRGKK